MSEVTIADSVADLHFRLTDEDRRRAVRGDSQRCVEARGVQRATGCTEDDTRIGQDIVHLRMPISREIARAARNRHLGLREGDVVWVRYRTSPSLNAMIGAYDEGAEFVPGLYTLRAPTPSQTLIAKAQRPRQTKRPGSRGPIAAKQWVRPRVALTA